MDTRTDTTTEAWPRLDEATAAEVVRAAQRARAALADIRGARVDAATQIATAWTGRGRSDHDRGVDEILALLDHTDDVVADLVGAVHAEVARLRERDRWLREARDRRLLARESAASGRHRTGPTSSRRPSPRPTALPCLQSTGS